MFQRTNVPKNKCSKEQMFQTLENDKCEFFSYLICRQTMTFYYVMNCLENTQKSNEFTLENVKLQHTAHMKACAYEACAYEASHDITN